MKKMSKLTWGLIILALAIVGFVVYKKSQEANATKTSSGIASTPASSGTAASSLKMSNSVVGPILHR